MQIFYESPPMLIGRKYQYEWRVIVRESHSRPGARVTEYQWRDPGLSRWQESHDWPSYDFNHTYYGLPLGLKKLWERFKPDIESALGNEPAQLRLF